MSAGLELRLIKDADRHIQTLQDEIDVLMARLTSITQHVKDVNVQSSKADMTAENIEKLIMLREEINQEIDRYADLKMHSHKIIRQMDNPKYSMVLMKYYFQNKTLEETAVEMDMSYQWICETRDRALKEYEKISKNLK